MYEPTGGKALAGPSPGHVFMSSWRSLPIRGSTIRRTSEAALQSIAVWLDLENCVGIAEGPGYFEVLRRLASEGHVEGGMVHDARIAALCLHHGVTLLWSSDRDFSRFPVLKLYNPMLEPA